MKTTSNFINLPTPEYKQRRWQIFWIDKLKIDSKGKRFFGECDFDNRIIYIYKHDSAESAADTLFHEIGHAIAGFEEDRVIAQADGSVKASKLLHKLELWPVPK